MRVCHLRWHDNECLIVSPSALDRGLLDWNRDNKAPLRFTVAGGIVGQNYPRRTLFLLLAEAVQYSAIRSFQTFQANCMTLFYPIGVVPV